MMDVFQNNMCDRSERNMKIQKMLSFETYEYAKTKTIHPRFTKITVDGCIYFEGIIGSFIQAFIKLTGISAIQGSRILDEPRLSKPVLKKT